MYRDIICWCAVCQDFLNNGVPRRSLSSCPNLHRGGNCLLMSDMSLLIQRVARRGCSEDGITVAAFFLV